MLIVALRAGAVAATVAVPLTLEVVLALSGGERTALGVAVAALVIGVIVGAYCIVRLARVEDIAVAGKAKADRLGRIIGVDGDDAPSGD